MDGPALSRLFPQVLVMVAIVVTLYWAIYLPNPGGLEKGDRVMRIVVRVLAVLVMLIVGAVVFMKTWQ